MTKILFFIILTQLVSNGWGWNPIFYFIGRRNDGRFEQEQSQTAGVVL